MRGQGLVRRVAFLRRNWPIRLAVCAIFRNEARYLAEWISFHRAQGVEAFFLYDNDSTDEWEPEIAPHRDVVEIRSLPGPLQQFPAYADCLRRHRTDTRWIAFIDIDEFLFSPTGRPLTEVLRSFSNVAAVAVNWRCYGTSGHELPADSMLRDFTLRAPDDHPSNRHVKSIVFPALTSTWVQNPHFFRLYGRAVGERGDPVTSALRDPPTAEVLRVNHYCTRSLTEWRQKVASPRADIPAPRWTADHDALNSVNDPYPVDV